MISTGWLKFQLEMDGCKEIHILILKLRQKNSCFFYNMVTIKNPPLINDIIQGGLGTASIDYEKCTVEEFGKPNR